MELNKKEDKHNKSLKLPKHPSHLKEDAFCDTENVLPELRLFAQDLISFYMKENFIQWETRKWPLQPRQQVDIRCNDSIKIAVRTIAIEDNINTEIDLTFQKQEAVYDYRNFLCLVQPFYVKCFPIGYFADNFLRYLALLSEIAAFSYFRGYPKVSEYVVHEVAFVLKDFIEKKEFDLFGGWDYLTEVAKLYE